MNDFRKVSRFVCCEGDAIGGSIVIKLEPMVWDDLQRIIEWNKSSSSEFLLQWSGEFESPLTKEQLERHFSYGVNENGSDKYIYKIVYTPNDQVVGTIALKLNRKNKSGKIGKFLIGEESMRGKGIGQLALEKLIYICFQEFSLHRISLGVYDFNSSAISCYEKVGFVKEGRDARKVGEKYWNLIEMSILNKQ